MYTNDIGAFGSCPCSYAVHLHKINEWLVRLYLDKWRVDEGTHYNKTARLPIHN